VEKRTGKLERTQCWWGYQSVQIFQDCLLDLIKLNKGRPINRQLWQFILNGFHLLVIRDGLYRNDPNL
jgi:hypothetical protein